MRALTCLSLVLFSVTALPALQKSAESPAWQRWKHLQHGVALSGWFSESGNYSMQQLRAFTTPADLEHIHQLGFDHVRIPIEPTIFDCGGNWNSCERIQFLDQVIQKAIASDLDVILDFHPNPQYTRQLVGSEQAAERYLRLWAQIADHYGKMDPDHIVLEVMNEIGSPEEYSWLGTLEESIRVIRGHAPNSTILVQGANYADIPDLIRLPVLADPNLIYDFHYYEPHIFTHQGATWGLEWWTDLHNLPFPPTDKGIADAIDAEDDPGVKWRLHQYLEDYRRPERIQNDIEFVAQWARQRNVPLICDEFGAYRNFSQPEERERWLTLVRTAFEMNHIGWTTWDYQGGFGVVYKENGARRDDDVALRGLGLKK
jgi:endoglucanase